MMQCSSFPQGSTVGSPRAAAIPVRCISQNWITSICWTMHSTARAKRQTSWNRLFPTVLYIIGKRRTAAGTTGYPFCFPITICPHWICWRRCIRLWGMMMHIRRFWSSLPMLWQGDRSLFLVFPIPRITQLPANTAAFSGSMLMPAMTNPTMKPIVQT